MKTRGNSLPNLKAFNAAFHKFGQEFRLRGIEITVTGTLTQAQDKWLLRVSKTGETLALAPLVRKVQWDPESSRLQTPTDKERDAYKNCLAQWKGKPLAVQIVGPLTEPKTGEPPVLEVREFVFK